MKNYKLKTPKSAEKISKTYKDFEKNVTEKFLEPDSSTESGYQLKTGKLGETVKETHKKIENATVNGYKKVENAVVNGYKKIEDKFIDAFLEPVETEEAEPTEESNETSED